MKLRTIAAAVAALATFQAHALDITTTNSANTVKIYAAGASAVSNVLAGIFVQNCASGLDIYGSDKTKPNFSTDGNNGDSHRVYSCTLKAEGQLDADLQGKGLGNANVALWKRDAGGSATGVFHVAVPLVSTNLVVSATSCTSTGATAGYAPGASRPTYSYLCGDTESVRSPDVGFSDVEPEFFKGINVPDDLVGTYGAGLNDTQLKSLTRQPTFQTVFAVAVSKALYDRLKADGKTVDGTTTGVPTISRVVAGSLMRGEMSDPSNGLGWHALGITVGADTQVNICRRAPGSGTQAAANLLASGFPCTSASIPDPVRNDASDTPDNNLSGPYTGGNLFVYEGGSTGNVRSCLTNANTAGAYAIGHISVENAEEAGWKFVALDGVVPSRDNLKNGKYDYAMESSVQYRKSLITQLSAGTAIDKAKAGFIQGFAKAVGRPANLAKIATANQNGVAALSGQGTFGGTGADGTFVSRVARTAGNNCTPLAVVK
ncbi:hypothetical protein AACH10_07295 [Ideonella sp. DXS22W]|uniref:PBP domain-containing protein n=1 Tax=Pseudaquabacterium inlustre TaxID=2984192 RepID=A0ABU9CDT3_9BURK